MTAGELRCEGGGETEREAVVVGVVYDDWFVESVLFSSVGSPEHPSVLLRWKEMKARGELGGSRK